MLFLLLLWIRFPSHTSDSFPHPVILVAFLRLKYCGSSYVLDDDDDDHTPIVPKPERMGWDNRWCIGISMDYLRDTQEECKKFKRKELFLLSFLNFCNSWKHHLNKLFLCPFLFSLLNVEFSVELSVDVASLFMNKKKVLGWSVDEKGTLKIYFAWKLCCILIAVPLYLHSGCWGTKSNPRITL